MKILRAEEIIYGVDDVAASTKFYEDWGLEVASRGAHGADFTMPSGQVVRVRAASDPALPATDEAGSTLREAIWGVDNAAALDEIGAALSRDREVKRDADGVLHSRDVHGFAIGFRVAQPKIIPETPTPSRRNHPFESAAPIKPKRLGHVVYFVSKAKQREGSDFYTDRLGFRISDRAMDMGDFLRASGSYDHHNIGLFWFRDKSHFGHVAFEVDSFDDVMIGGKRLQRAGWKATNKPGRHIVGSNVFWNFQNPAGGNAEYFYDMDIMDDEWQPRIWEKFPGLAHWVTE
jgi:catechol 2,3-dioxygenase-like lactoylglutathione lyase family enzyme